jgi:anti-sigma factor RsiW
MMQCKIAQRQMALAVGDDLDQAEAQELQRHLAQCSVCRGLWEQHRQVFAVLQDSRVVASAVKRDSVWPSVATRLQQRHAGGRREVNSLWISGLAIAAAIVVVFVFSQDGQVPPQGPVRGNMFSDSIVGLPSNDWKPQVKSSWVHSDDAKSRSDESATSSDFKNARAARGDE